MYFYRCKFIEVGNGNVGEIRVRSCHQSPSIIVQVVKDRSEGHKLPSESIIRLLEPAEVSLSDV